MGKIKLQSSLERDSGGETMHSCRTGMFQIYTFSCPKIIECSIWSVL